MSDSDGEFVGGDMSDDDLLDHQVTDDRADEPSNSAATTKPRGSRRGVGGRKKGGGRSKAAWEDVKRSWETVTEGADGHLAVWERLEADKRQRLLRDTTPLQRGIIRHLMLVLDVSFAMAEKDLLPTRLRLTWQYAREFVREYFEQNPISQMGIVAMRDGVAVRMSDMSGNPAEHLERLREWEGKDAQGSPSLQNALEMCRGALFHTPSHGTREVLVIYGALLSSDPGDIHDTISNLIKDRIRVSVVGLSAQVAICAELCARTNAGDDTQYNVAMDETHYRELFLRTTTPPVTRTQAQNVASLLMMGFPSRTLAAAEASAYCACHNKPVREGYLCTRCGTRVCRLPAECPACGLTLILSTHLARSYHHLFPLRNWVEVPWSSAHTSSACYSCLTPFPQPPRKKRKNKWSRGQELDGNGTDGPNGVEEAEDDDEEERERERMRRKDLKGVSESGRYACEVCGNHFCIDCDVFAHEVIHNCPGCQSNTSSTAEINGQGEQQLHEQTNGAMEVDS